MAKRRKLIAWILGSAPFACGLGALAALVQGETLLIALTFVVIYGSMLAGVVWLGGFLTRGLRLNRALTGGFNDKALRWLQKWGKNEDLLEVLRGRIPFPSDAVRTRMTDAVRELLALQKAAADRSNPHIPEDLRKDIKRRSRELLFSLWPKCQDLSLLARPGMDQAAVEAKVSQILTPLEDLAEIIGTTRRQLVRSTLEGSSLEIHEALESAGAMKWQVSEAPRIDAMLEG